MKRIFLFVVINLAVLALLGLVIFIIEQVSGVRLGWGDAGGLLVFAALFGFEPWLLGTVAGLAAPRGQW